MAAPEVEVRALYHALLEAWNRNDAVAYAAGFAEDGEIVGFDGSQEHGSAEIAEHLRQIFAGHAVPTYVSKVRRVRLLGPDVALLTAVAGMVPPGKSDIEPMLNVVQSLVAERQAGRWRIVLFQNTPAQFHGRPEASDSLTQELREVLSAADPGPS